MVGFVQRGTVALYIYAENLAASCGSTGTTWQKIDEAGLFVENPYLKQKAIQPFRPATPQIQLLGQQQPDIEEGLEDYLEEISNPYEAGHLLSAYKQFTPIHKENYFTLLFRWSITFH